MSYAETCVRLFSWTRAVLTSVVEELHRPLLLTVVALSLPDVNARRICRPFTWTSRHCRTSPRAADGFRLATLSVPRKGLPSRSSFSSLSPSWTATAVRLPMSVVYINRIRNGNKFGVSNNRNCNFCCLLSEICTKIRNLSFISVWILTCDSEVIYWLYFEMVIWNRGKLHEVENLVMESYIMCRLARIFTTTTWEWKKRKYVHSFSR